MSPDGLIELRLGDWRDVLCDVQCDAVITDPPYSAATHAGQRTGTSTDAPTIHYAHSTRESVREFAESWSPRSRDWMVAFSDHVLAVDYGSSLTACGLYVFAPVVMLRTSPTPRFAGDGPTSAAEYITVARPRKKPRRSGSRPGYYLTTGHNSSGHAGAKPIGVMRAIVRDYTDSGGIICDPYAGSGTTLIAARDEGRRAIGAEVDEETFLLAVRRLSSPSQCELFSM